MTNRPINPGECLIIPKEHIDQYYDIPDETASRIMVLGQKISRKIKERFNPIRVGYAVSGFGIPHAHLVIVPLIDHGDIVSVKNLKIVDNKIKFDLEQVLIQPRSELNRIAKLISDDLL